jgi:hypothetical protein
VFALATLKTSWEVRAADRAAGDFDDGIPRMFDPGIGYAFAAHVAFAVPSQRLHCRFLVSVSTAVETHRSNDHAAERVFGRAMVNGLAAAGDDRRVRPRNSSFPHRCSTMLPEELGHELARGYQENCRTDRGLGRPSAELASFGSCGKRTSLCFTGDGIIPNDSALACHHVTEARSCFPSLWILPQSSRICLG